jgi:hypothetical protein
VSAWTSMSRCGAMKTEGWEGNGGSVSRAHIAHHRPYRRHVAVPKVGREQSMVCSG